MSRALAVVVVLLAPVVARTARAYPQFQLSTGASRCAQCHVNPAGGGLLNSFGRDMLTDEIARAGSGDLLHDVWTPPSWLALGGDFRGAAAVVRDGAGAGPEGLLFPMQAELYVQLRAGSLSAVLAAGARGTARGQTAQRLDCVGSREHYLMWRPATQGPFVRAGGFMLPHGLRLAEHPSYVRRFGGTDLEEEPLAVSGGFSNRQHELHVTAFTRAPIRCAGLGCAKAGAAVLYERRLGERSALGAQGLAATFASEMGHRQAGGGVLGKHAFEHLPLLLLAELDYRARFFSAADTTSHQALAYVGATLIPTRGVFVTVAADGFAEDLATPGATRGAGAAHAQFFPWAHVEIAGYIRVTDRGSAVALLMLHYTL